MKVLAEAIQLYRLGHDHCPAGLEDLLRPDEENGFERGYLSAHGLLPDPWDASWIYETTGDDWTLRSGGPDGEPKTPEFRSLWFP